MDMMSDNLPGILLVYSAFLLTILSPGPNNLAVIGASMSAGRASGIALAFGISTGSFTWAMMTVLGLSALLASHAGALMMIKITGGCYLLWLSYRSFRAAAAPPHSRTVAMRDPSRTLIGYHLRGMLIQMTNPKAAFTWIAIISLGLQPDANPTVSFAIVAGTTLIAVTVHVAYAFAFSTASVVRTYSAVHRYVQGALGAFFALAGLRLLTSR